MKASGLKMTMVWIKLYSALGVNAANDEVDEEDNWNRWLSFEDEVDEDLKTITENAD